MAERKETGVQLTEEFERYGASPPRGLLHIVYHVGSSRREVYRALWGSLMFVGKLTTGGKRTLVYPKCVLEAVRERFGNDPNCGAYDHQYEDEESVYHVTMDDLRNVKWRKPPKSCKVCHP